ncbi:uncharacterized protein LOC143211724 [Lasioglossum baleicum]|uniref:uncharacterized protein LOC143211724 n=1 Tax=Lasioglossum baleicum TaxID=434251 RepID=UPI003FCD5028
MEVYKTRKKFYKLDNESETFLGYLWTIWVPVLVVLLLIVLCIFCYLYNHGRIISICKRCLTRQNKERNIDDRVPIFNEDNNELCSKPLCLNACKTSRSKKSNNQRNRQHEDTDYELKTILPEKEKLLNPSGSKTEDIANSADLRKRLLLKISAASFLSANKKSKITNSEILNKRDIKDLEHNKDNETSTPSITLFDRNKNDKSICFSDTDLKLLTKPIFSETSEIKKHDEKILFCEWNSRIIDNYYKEHTDTGSKLIELKFRDTNPFNDDTHEYGNRNSRIDYSHCSFTSKTCDSKYFSDSVISRLDSFPNLKLKHFQRSINSSTASSMSTTNTVKIKYPLIEEAILKNHSEVLNVKSRKNSDFAIDKYGSNSTKQLHETESKIRLYEYIRQLKRMKSSVDIQLNCFREIKSPRRKTKSDENVTYGIISPTVRSRINNCFSPRDFTTLTESLVHSNEGTRALLDQQSEVSETYNELGMLFSQYLKHQIHLCERKACPLSRHLKRRSKHSTKQCRRKLNYRQTYPYDQRPACNSGNVCTDTYDELKLMCTSPSKRNNIYRCMFTRRKEFLNQSCSIPVQNIVTTM